MNVLLVRPSRNKARLKVSIIVEVVELAREENTCGIKTPTQIGTYIEISN